MNLSASWDLQIDPSVFKILKKAPRYDAEAILGVMKLLPADPYFGDVKKMRGQENVWRRRVGSYRIFYKLFFVGKIILVFHFERRVSKTY